MSQRGARNSAQITIAENELAQLKVDISGKAEYTFVSCRKGNNHGSSTPVYVWR